MHSLRLERPREMKIKQFESSRDFVFVYTNIILDVLCRLSAWISSMIVSGLSAFVASLCVFKHIEPFQLCVDLLGVKLALRTLEGIVRVFGDEEGAVRCV